MRPYHPALLVGPYDWHAEILPVSVFAARIAALRAAAGEELDLLVHGDRLDASALGYLCHFVPKLGPALALLPWRGAPQLLFSGGGGMAPSARRMTWIEELRALGNIERNLSDILGRPERSRHLGLVGGRGMSRALHRALLAALPADTSLLALDGELDALRRHKSVEEIALLRRSAEVLHCAMQTLLSTQGPLTNAVLAAERVAYAQGAQDVRVLVDGVVKSSLRLAVRHSGYWTEAGTIVGAPAATSGKRAGERLGQALGALRPGMTLDGLHAVLPDDSGLKLSVTGLGLSPEEAPFLARPSESLAEGDVCLVQVSAADANDMALVSVPILVGASTVTSLCPIPLLRVQWAAM